MMKENILILSILLFFSSMGFALDENVAEEGITQSAPDQTAILAASPTISAPKLVTEENIPLNIEAIKKGSEATSTSNRLFLTGFILMGILGTTYYLVRKYKLSNNINKSNKQIKIISQHYLGPKKSLAIIHVAGESILIGVTDQNISMIKSLSLIDDEVPAHLPQNFSDSLQLKTTPPAGASVKSSSVDELEEEFSFSGIKDSVSKKIKSMRSFS